MSKIPLPKSINPKNTNEWFQLIMNEIRSLKGDDAFFNNKPVSLVNSETIKSLEKLIESIRLKTNAVHNIFMNIGELNDNAIGRKILPTSTVQDIFSAMPENTILIAKVENFTKMPTTNGNISILKNNDSVCFANFVSTDGIIYTSNLNKGVFSGWINTQEDKKVKKAKSNSTSNEILLDLPPVLYDMYYTYFISSKTNLQSIPTTINGIPVYVANSSAEPVIKANEVYMIYYDLAKNVFFLK